MIGKLVLPYPISANDFWRTRAYKAKDGGKLRSIVYQTPEAEAWKKTAELLARNAGFREPLLIAVELRIVHHHQSVVQGGKRVGQRNGHVFDLDNVLKVSIDGLKGIVFADDKQVKKIVAEYGAETPKGGLVVEVHRFEVPETLALFPDASLGQRGELKKVRHDDLPF